MRMPSVLALTSSVIAAGPIGAREQWNDSLRAKKIDKSEKGNVPDQQAAREPRMEMVACHHLQDQFRPLPLPVPLPFGCF